MNTRDYLHRIGRQLALLLLAAAPLFAQCPTGTLYPGALDTNTSLTVAKNNLTTTLTANQQIADTVAIVSSTTGFTANMMIAVDSGATTEYEFVGSVSGANTLNVTRACESSTAIVHSAGVAVVNIISAYSGHTSLTGAVTAVETLIRATPTAHNIPVAEGTSPFNYLAPGTAGNVFQSNGASADPTFQPFGPGTGLPAGSQLSYLRVQPNTGNNTTLQFSANQIVSSSDYNFGPGAVTAAYSCNAGLTCAPGGANGGSLVIGNNTLTMTPVPLGMNGTDLNHLVYVSGGTGAAETCTITGGAGTSGQASGAIIINCANTHSGAWTIQSASAGITEAIQSQGAGTVLVRIPPGSFNTYGVITINGNGVWIQGAGQDVTVIANQTTDSSNVFTVTAGSLGGFNAIRDLAISAPSTGGAPPTTKAGGFGIALNNQEFFTAQNLFMTTVPNGISNVNSGGFFQNISISEPKPVTGEGIFNNGGNAFDTIYQHITVNASATYKAGIEIVSSGYTALDRVDLIHATADLLIDPGAAQNVLSVDVLGSYFDTPATNGVNIAPTGGGLVARTRFIDCWTSSAGAGPGFSINATGAGTIVDGILIIGLHALLNNQQGILIGATAPAVTKNIEIYDSIVSGNSLAGSGIYDGIAAGGNITNIKVSGNVSAQSAQMVNFQSRGMQISTAGVDFIAVTDNDFTLNVNGPFLDQSTGTHKIIHDNLGIDSAVPVTIASAASIALSAADFSVTYISGTTTTTTITGGWINRKVTLIKTDAGSLTVGGGGNVPLAHTMTQNTSLILTFDGTNWY